MQTIRNKTGRPIQVHLFGGKTLHLGPRKTGEISDQTAELPSFRKLVEDGTLEVVGGSGNPADRENGDAVPHESTHGHKPPTVVMPKGNR